MKIQKNTVSLTICHPTTKLMIVGSVPQRCSMPPWSMDSLNDVRMRPPSALHYMNRFASFFPVVASTVLSCLSKAKGTDY